MCHFNYKIVIVEHRFLKIYYNINFRMKKFILLSIFLTLAASTNDEGEIIESGPGNGLLCLLGLVFTPILGTTYALTRCLISEGAQAFTCVWEDLGITLLSMLGVALGTCVFDSGFNIN